MRRKRDSKELRQSLTDRLNLGFLEGPDDEKGFGPRRRGQTLQVRDLRGRELGTCDVHGAVRSVGCFHIDADIAFERKRANRQTFSVGQIDLSGASVGPGSISGFPWALPVNRQASGASAGKRESITRSRTWLVTNSRRSFSKRKRAALARSELLISALRSAASSLGKSHQTWTSLSQSCGGIGAIRPGGFGRRAITRRPPASGRPEAWS